jgi:hypothetical protein
MAERGASDGQIAEALRRLVDDGVREGAYVILAGGPSRPYYVQFAVDGGLLWCEAVHNERLEPAHRLGRRQIRQLKLLGWHDPPQRGQNYVRAFTPERPEDYLEIARLVREAFSSAYGLPAGARLSLNCRFADRAPARPAAAGPAPAPPPRPDRLWLKCFLVTRRSDEALVEWAPEPLPADLRVTQLPSFLAQRYGTPLEAWDGRVGGAVFRAPDGIGPRGATLVAVPLIAGADDESPRPVTERLHDVGLAFSRLSLDLLGGLALDELWVGPLVDPEAVGQPANDAAARACRAWLLGLGLVRLVRGAIEHAQHPLSVPGVDELADGLEASARTAHAEAEQANALCASLDATGRRPRPSGASLAAKAQAAERDLLGHHLAVGVAAREAERTLRSLAQLAFGVSSRTAGGPWSSLLDRAAVAALHPPEGDGPRAGLSQDGLAFHARTRDELVLEIAGLVGRLLVERVARVRLGVRRGGPAVLLEVDLDDSLHVRLEGGGARPEAESPRRWSSPMVLTLPAERVVHLLYDRLGLARPSQVRVEVLRRVVA